MSYPTSWSTPEMAAPSLLEYGQDSDGQWHDTDDVAAESAGASYVEAGLGLRITTDDGPVVIEGSPTELEDLFRRCAEMVSTFRAAKEGGGSE